MSTSTSTPPLELTELGAAQLHVKQLERANEALRASLQIAHENLKQLSTENVVLQQRILSWGSSEYHQMVELVKAEHLNFQASIVALVQARGYACEDASQQWLKLSDEFNELRMETPHSPAELQELCDLIIATMTFAYARGCDDLLTRALDKARADVGRGVTA